MRNKIIWSVIFVFGFVKVWAQDLDSSKYLSLPLDHYFKSLWIDPMQGICSSGLYAYREEGLVKKGVYFPFVIGAQKELLRKKIDQNHGYEFGFEVASYTQFEIITPNGVYQRNLLNIDYRICMHLNVKNNAWSYRARFFHESSHLGDDYMIRNKIHAYLPNPLNYEQLDFTAALEKGRFNYYAGLGAVVRIETIRKRFSAQTGFSFSFPVNEKARVKYVGGMDLKFLQQTNYDVNAKMCAGFQFGKGDESPKFVVEFYTGHLPFSLYEYKKVQWLGIGLYFNVI